MEGVLWFFVFVELLNENGMCCLKNLFIDVRLFFDLFEYGEYGFIEELLLDKLVGWFELFDV